MLSGLVNDNVIAVDMSLPYQPNLKKKEIRFLSFLSAYPQLFCAICLTEKEDSNNCHWDFEFKMHLAKQYVGFPGGASSKEPTC